MGAVAKAAILKQKTKGKKCVWVTAGIQQGDAKSLIRLKSLGRKNKGVFLSFPPSTVSVPYP